MKKYAEPYADPDDMFSDTRMTFGEHIEDLRTHLLRAIYGFMIGMLLAMFIGKPVMRFIAKPVEDQLKEFWDRYNHEKLKGMEDAMNNGDQGKVINIAVRVPLRELARRLNLPPPKDPPLELVPAFVEVFEMLELEDAINHKALTSERYMLLYPDPKAYARSLVRFNQEMRPPTLATLSVQEAFFVWFKVCLMTGLVISSPWVFFQIWAFIAAGLYPHEKKMVNVYLPFSLGLFLAGVFICEFFVIPKAISALLWFNEWLGLQPDLRLNEWLGFAIMMPLVFGISFQTPLVMLFAERVGVMSVAGYREKRRFAIIAMAIFSAFITPSTDAFSMMFLLVPMCLLYELGIVLCQLQPRSEIEDMDMADAEEMVEV